MKWQKEFDRLRAGLDEYTEKADDAPGVACSTTRCSTIPLQILVRRQRRTPPLPRAIQPRQMEAMGYRKERGEERNAWRGVRFRGPLGWGGNTDADVLLSLGRGSDQPGDPQPVRDTAQAARAMRGQIETQPKKEEKTMSKLKPDVLKLSDLLPHPQNPRKIERRDVIDAIAAQLRATGKFDPAHALLARPLESKYQIISGHNRAIAAREAGLVEVPVWVREMDDDAAFMQLVLSNTQGELSPLERGMHALEATEKGKHGKSVKWYADQVKRPQQSIDREVRAARVAESYSSMGNFAALVEKTVHLAAIHEVQADACRQALVKRMVDKEWNVEATKKAVKAVLEAKPPRGYEKLFPLEKLQEMVAAGDDVKEFVALGTRTIEHWRGNIRDVQFEIEKHLAEFEQWLQENGGWDDKAITAQAQEITGRQRALRAEAEKKANRMKQAVTLPEWKTMTTGEQEAALAMVNPKARFVKQGTDCIEWALWSWNPVTGCEHECRFYCYARDIAVEIYPQGFVPSLIPEALSAPLNMKVPKEAATNLGLKNVFVGSMADLFGNWVPKEWIEKVLSYIRQASEWNFLVLTKFPKRYAEFDLPPNVWAGTTVDMQARVANAERAMRNTNATVGKWLSIEPMIEPIAWTSAWCNGR